MKNLLLLACLFFGFVGGAQEQDNSVEKQSIEEMALLNTKRMALSLDLNAEQQEKILKIQKKRIEDQREIRADARKELEEKPQNNDEERAEIQNELKNVELEYQEKLQEILTGEQYAKWKEIRDKREKGRGTRN